MSNEVDKRIIEMEFKNAEFEKNAARTLQTLQELKQKLNDNFSTKGPEKLNEAIKAVDVSPISQGLENVQLKFSALQIAGKRVIENITDAAMNAINKVRVALAAPINQIITGGARRAQNIEQAKFMLSGLGIEWKDIVDDINYGVQDTAYGLDAAARVASQLVASNVSLGKDMQASLRGVSGVAAMTNSTYEEIGHIFTSVAGQGKLMSMQLQQFSLRGLNVAADLAKSMNTTEAAIRDMVTKGQIDFMTFARAMDELYGGHAKEANNTFTGALSNTKAALSRLGADIQSQKFESFRIILLEITTQLKELKKAFKPAEDAIISMMDAVGKLVTNFIKSINIKAIVERITPSIKKVADYVRDFADAWRMLREEKAPFDNIADYVKKLREGMEDTKEATDDALTSLEKLVQASDTDLKRYSENAWAIWNEGKFGNGQDRVNALKEDYELTQAYVDKMIELGWDQAQMDEYLAEQKKKVEEQQKKQETVNRLKNTVSKVLTIFTNLRTVLHNITSSIVNVLGATFGGLSEAISGKGSGFLDALIFLTGKLSDFTTKIAITKERAEKIKPIFKAIGDIIVLIGKGLYTCIKYVILFIEAAANNKVVKTIFEAIASAINKIFEGLKKVYTKLKENGVWDKFVNVLKIAGTWLGEKIVTALVFLGDHAEGLFTAMGKGFGKVVEWLEDVIIKLGEGNGILGSIKDFFVKGVETGGSWIEKIGDKLSLLFGNEGDTEDSIFKKAFNRAAAFGRGIIEGLNSISWDDLKKAGGIVAKIATAIGLLSFLGSLTSLNTSVSKFFRGLSNLMQSLTSLTYSSALRAAAASVESLARALLIIVGAIVGLTLAMQLIPGGEEAVQKSIEIVYEFAVLIGFFETLMAWVEKTKILNKGKKISITLNARKLAMAAILTAMATMLYTFFQYIKFISKGLTDEDPDKQLAFTHSMTIAFTMIIGIFSILVIYVLAIMRMAEKLKGSIVGPQLLESISKVVSGFTSSLIKIMLTIALVTYIISKMENPKAFNKAFGLLIAIFAGLLTIVGWAALVSANMTEAKAEDVKIMTEFFRIISGCISGLMLALAGMAYVFSKVSPGDILFALLSMAVIFGALVGGLAIINAIKIGDESAFNTKMNALIKLASMLALVIAAFAGLALSLAVMKNMGVSMKEFLAATAIITGAIAILVGLGGIAGLLGGTSGIEAVGSLLAGFGVALMGVAVSIVTFALALKILVDVLPRFCDAFETFHNQILEKRDIVVAGIGDFVGVLAQGLLVGIIQALNSLINNLEPIIEALIDTVIVICNVLGSALINRSSELADAIGTLFEGIITVVVEAIGEAIGGIIMGLSNAIIDLREKVSKWMTPEGYTEEADVGAWKDDQAQAFAQRLTSTTTPEDRRRAYKRWLRENGYNEDGTRNETWTVEIVVDYKTAYDIENKNNSQSKSDWYNDMYGAKKTSENVKKQADEVKENTEKAADAWTESNKNAGIIDDLSSAVTDKFNSAKDKISNVDVGNAIGDVTDMIPQLNEDSFNTDAIDNYKETLHTEAEETASTTQEYADVVNEKTKILETAISDMANNISNTFKELKESCVDYGKGIVDGISEGMYNMAAEVTLRKACLHLTNVISESITGPKGLDERSPSHVMEKYGIFAVMGLANGILGSVGIATSATEEAGAAAILSMRDTIRNASLEAVNGIDQPRITPVLDLSNITDGMETMNGMFDNSPAYKLAMATSGEARAANTRRTTAIYQNGSAYDDTNAIGAINSLNAEVSTLKDAINGMQVVIDGRALVGQIATPMDKALGKRTLAGRRTV